MTSPGQLKIQVLIPCIQDSNSLYDFVVRLMFLLHANLPDDLLSGHRERFRTLFRQLNSFYRQAGQLQYFVSLIKVRKNIIILSSNRYFDIIFVLGTSLALKPPQFPFTK